MFKVKYIKSGDYIKFEYKFGRMKCYWKYLTPEFN